MSTKFWGVALFYIAICIIDVLELNCHYQRVVTEKSFEMKIVHGYMYNDSLFSSFCQMLIKCREAAKSQ